MIKKLMFLLILLFGLSQAKILIFNDISVEPIDPLSNPDYRVPADKQQPAQALNYREGVYLVSYADGHEIFYKNQHALTLSALNKGIDFFLNYRRSHLDIGFVEKNAKILNQDRGKGYWLWKPWVILKTLLTVPENAIVIYADSGFVFRGSVAPLIELAKKQDVILTAYNNPDIFDFRLEKHASRKLLESMGCDTPQCRQQPHLWAGFLVLRNTEKSRDFIQKWLNYCSDPKIMMPSADSRPQYPTYSHHLDDESILSVLRAKEPKGKYLLPAEELWSKYVTWHHRRYDKPLKQDNEYYSILPNMYKQIRGIERKIVNSYLMVKIRKWVLTTFSVIYFKQSPSKTSLEDSSVAVK